MADIGAILREARMRARIDISEIEAATKIRAKYLRALENEEWDLLPGPTYVKSFLRTYAEALGLDARMLVEDYKLRYERVGGTEAELRQRPVGGGAARRRPARRGGGRPPVPPGAIVALLVVLLLGGLALLGSLSGGSKDSSSSSAATTSVPARGTTTKRPRTRHTKSRPKHVSPFVRLSLAATGAVNICLKAGDRVLIKDETLDAGTKRGPFRSKDFRISLGNNLVRLRVNGKTVAPRASPNPIGLRITRKGRTTLPDAQRPVCTP